MNLHPRSRTFARPHMTSGMGFRQLNIASVYSTNVPQMYIPDLTFLPSQLELLKEVIKVVRRKKEGL